MVARNVNIDEIHCRKEHIKRDLAVLLSSRGCCEADRQPTSAGTPDVSIQAEKLA
jgi:hypothetical protein